MQGVAADVEEIGVSWDGAGGAPSDVNVKPEK